MNQTLKVLITGTNKGLGNDLVKIFINKNPEAIVYATSRELPQIAYGRSWSKIDANKRVICKHLDVSSENSIQSFVEQIRKDNIVFDIVVNNAGVFMPVDNKNIPNFDQTKNLMNTNVLGPITLTQKLLPNLTQTCKIVQISSLLAALNFQPKHIQTKFSDPNITLQNILSSVQSYLKAIQNKNIEGWSYDPYGTSKMIMNAWSRFVLQKKWLKSNQIAISVSPGLCRTPMTKNFFLDRPAHSSESGALKIYQTIFLKNVTSQIFYHRRRPSDYVLCGQGLSFQDEP